MPIIADIRIHVHIQVSVSNNSDRRKLYSRLELLKMDIEEARLKENFETKSVETLIKQIDELGLQQKLVPLKGRKTVRHNFKTGVLLKLQCC